MLKFFSRKFILRSFCDVTLVVFALEVNDLETRTRTTHDLERKSRVSVLEVSHNLSAFLEVSYSSLSEDVSQREKAKQYAETGFWAFKKLRRKCALNWEKSKQNEKLNCPIFRKE